MGRTVSSDLQSMLDLPACMTHTTLDLTYPNGTQKHFTTAAQSFTANGFTYTPDLRVTGEIKQSILQSIDRVTATIQNIDQDISTVIKDESIIKAKAVVGRYYVEVNGTVTSTWVELFRGEVRPTGLDEFLCSIEILNDLAAAGYCVGHWTLAPNCQFQYKHAATCGFAGAATTCNKKRNSLDGCAGKIVSGSTTNEYRFGGMESADPEVPSTPTGGDDNPVIDPPPPYCPRLDQYVLVRGMSGDPLPKAVKDLHLRDLLFDPTTRTFHELKSLTIIPDQPIFQLVADNFAACYSSASHRIIRTPRDTVGTPVEDLYAGYSIMTWRKNSIAESTVDLVEEKGRGDVLNIKMKTSHIYCAGNTPKAFIVAHNSKPPLDY